jgi:hypothetical protein
MKLSVLQLKAQKDLQRDRALGLAFHQIDIQQTQTNFSEQKLTR